MTRQDYTESSTPAAGKRRGKGGRGGAKAVVTGGTQHEWEAAGLVGVAVDALETALRAALLPRLPRRAHSACPRPRAVICF
jgi:hypothetical protein